MRVERASERWRVIARSPSYIVSPMANVHLLEPEDASPVLWPPLAFVVSKATPVVNKVLPVRSNDEGGLDERALRKGMRGVYMFEALVATPLCYLAALHDHALVANVVEFTFWAFSCISQWCTAEALNSVLPLGDPQDDAPRRWRTRNEVQERALYCIPISCLGIPKCIYEVATLSPNFITVLQAAVLAGEHARTWDGSVAQQQFQQNFSVLPNDQSLFVLFFNPNLVGLFPSLLVCEPGLPCRNVVCEAGLPSLLAWLVVFTVVTHYSMFFSDWVFGWRSSRVADSANLRYIGKALRGGANNAWVTGLIALGVKTCKLWIKVSLVSVTWSESGRGVRFQGALAIVLGFYALKPAADLLNRLRRTRMNQCHVCSCCVLVYILGSILFVIVMIVRVAGIGICDSHDFSLVRKFYSGVGCTAPVGNHTNRTAVCSARS